MPTATVTLSDGETVEEYKDCCFCVDSTRILYVRAVTASGLEGRVVAVYNSLCWDRAVQKEE